MLHHVTVVNVCCNPRPYDLALDATRVMHRTCSPKQRRSRCFVKQGINEVAFLQLSVALVVGVQPILEKAFEVMRRYARDILDLRILPIAIGGNEAEKAAGSGTRAQKVPFDFSSSEDVGKVAGVVHLGRCRLADV